MKRDIKTTLIVILLVVIAILCTGIVFLHFNAVNERAVLRRNQEKMIANQKLMIARQQRILKSVNK